MCTINLPQVFLKSNTPFPTNNQMTTTGPREIKTDFVNGYFMDSNEDKFLYTRLVEYGIPYRFQTINKDYFKNEKMWIAVDNIWHTVSFPDGCYTDVAAINSFIREWLTNPLIRYDSSGPSYAFKFGPTGSGMRYPIFFDTNLAKSKTILIIQNIPVGTTDINDVANPPTSFLVQFTYPAGPFAANDPPQDFPTHYLGDWIGFPSWYTLPFSGTDASPNGILPAPYGGGSENIALTEAKMFTLIDLGFYIESFFDLRVDCIDNQGDRSKSIIAHLKIKNTDRVGAMIYFDGISDSYDCPISQIKILRNFSLRVTWVLTPEIPVIFNSGECECVLSMLMKS